jgi:SAM-dependent methyltransferase
VFTIDFDLIKIKSGERILDAGCGSGRHSWEICRLADCTAYSLDIEEEDLRRTRYVFKSMDERGESNGKWEAIKGDIMDLPFRDACFDEVICSEVLEHVLDDQQGVRELVRVLKKGGIMAVSVPTYLTEVVYWRLSKDYSHPGGHIRKFKFRQITDLLEKNNLSIYAVRRKHALHSIYWLLRCLFGINNEKARIPLLYHRFLAWDIATKHKFFRLLEDFLNVFFPKSIVIYALKKGEDW